MRRLKRILQIADKITEWSGKLTSYLLILAVLAMSYEVIARYFFNSPTVWAHELTQIMYGAVIVMGGSFALRYREHIRMDLLYLRMSPKKRVITDLITAPLMFMVIIALVWKAWQYGYLSLLDRQHSGTIWNPPVYPFMLFIFLAASLLLLQALVKFIRDIISATERKELS